MNRTLEQYHRDVICGAERGVGASVMRVALRGIEPFYATATSLRNAIFELGIRRNARGARPVISVGNITTGGTGKTPVVRWLAQRLIAAGQHPAVLLRGYKGGDEQRMLQAQLGPDIIIEANPNRAQAAQHVASQYPDVSVFLLDDGFQHRQLHRNFDLVLIDATNPFGFGHVLPRGLLREPLTGLLRASAFSITHSDSGDSSAIESTLRRYNPIASILRCEHAQSGFAGPNPIGRKAFAFCGIGNPQALDRQLEAAGVLRVGSRWFGDHHGYTVHDLHTLRDRARQLGAEMLVTTEKDWVKLAELVGQVPDLPPVVRAELAIRFAGEDESKLLGLIMAAIGSSKTPPPPPESLPRARAAKG